MALNSDDFDLTFLQSLFSLCSEHGVSSFEAQGIKVVFAAGRISQPEIKASEPIELTEDVPTEDELLFGASGFQVNQP